MSCVKRRSLDARIAVVMVSTTICVDLVANEMVSIGLKMVMSVVRNVPMSLIGRKSVMMKHFSMNTIELSGH